jgi:pimeloyl-ACP methyl ester carboxylesterase
VPLDYDRPRNRRITLALIRLPATDQARRVGTLFPNPGGPGGSGVDFVRGAAKLVYTPALRARFDIVGMDPRGVGGSTPVRCFASRAEEVAFEATYPYIPNPWQERLAARKSLELAARCWARSGWLLPHLSTANVARDLDLLRQAVGDAGLNYLGYSYGTFLGATYANLFPGRVRALVLDSVINPALYARRQPGLLGPVPFLRIGSDVGAAATLRLWGYLGQPCATWPHDSDRYLGPWYRRTSAPVLVIGTRYDPATAYHNAVQLSRIMPRSRLLTLDGWGHPTLVNSTCIDKATYRYLIDSVLPANGTVCRSDTRPFGPPPSPRG